MMRVEEKKENMYTDNIPCKWKLEKEKLENKKQMKNKEKKKNTESTNERIVSKFYYYFVHLQDS